MNTSRMARLFETVDIAVVLAVLLAMHAGAASYGVRFARDLAARAHAPISAAAQVGR